MSAEFTGRPARTRSGQRPTPRADTCLVGTEALRSRRVLIILDVDSSEYFGIVTGLSRKITCFNLQYSFKS